MITSSDAIRLSIDETKIKAKAMGIRIGIGNRIRLGGGAGEGKIILSRNADIVECGGYLDIVSSGTDINTNTLNRSYLNKNNIQKIRINGTITSVSFYTNVLTNTTGLYIQFWRLVESVYTLIYEEDIYSQLSDASTNTITLATPYNAQEGDMICFWSDSSVSDKLYKATGVAADSLLYNTGDKLSTGFDWDSALKLAYAIPVKCYGQAPLVVSIGDSIIAGHTGHYSYRENSLTDNKLNSITGQLYLLDNKYICQNMGDGGDTTTQILARFTTDVINLRPKVAIINGGVNDIAGGSITKSTYLSNWTSMLDACATADIVPVACKIIPWTNGSNEQMQTRDEWMTDLESLVATYAGSVWVDFDAAMGKFRVGGDVGNLWDLQTTPDYDQDGVHPTLLGYTKMAEIIDTAIKTIYTLG